MSLVRVSTDIITYTLTEGNSVIQLSPSQALDALQQFAAMSNQITADNQVTPPSIGFQGIYNFSGTIDAKTQFVDGTYLHYAWSDLEPTEGQFNWNLIDTQMQPWIDAGKKVILRVSTAGWKKWTTPNNPSWTPQWVYDKGVKNIIDDDGSKKPAYWDMKFLLALQNFIIAFGAKYDNHPHVACIEMGIGDGGESKVDTSKGSDVLNKWKAIGYTDDLWFSAIKEIILMYKTSFPTTPRVVMPDASFIGGSNSLNMASVISYAQTQGCWLQDNGLVKGENFQPLKWNMPLLSEQRNPTNKSGETLDFDLNLAINTDKAKIVLIFTEDLVNQKNQAILQKYSAMKGK